MATLREKDFGEVGDLQRTSVQLQRPAPAFPLNVIELLDDIRVLARCGAAGRAPCPADQSGTRGATRRHHSTSTTAAARALRRPAPTRRVTRLLRCFFPRVTMTARLLALIETRLQSAHEI